jgi:glycogen debranching enzyme
VIDVRAVDPVALWATGLGHLRALRTDYGFAATARGGLYNALFGRDSLWMLLLLLDTVSRVPHRRLDSWVAAAGGDILTALAGRQGQRIDDSVEEQPGRILHEFRPEQEERPRPRGLVLRDGVSYSGFDQTFLFVTACRRFVDRYGTEALPATVWDAVARALDWITHDADEDGDGLFEYTRRDPRNLLNQVWKDSFDSVVHTGFDVPPPPLAWIDVQGYGYRAQVDGSHLCRLRSDHERARSLDDGAAALRRRVREAFWMEDEGFFAMALDGAKRQVPMVSSNVGHALWAGLVGPEDAARVVDRLLKSDLTTPYGVRTVSAASPFYAPLSYHRGSVWPFDNAICTVGLLAHGYRAEALGIARGVGAVLLEMGSPHELYVVLDAGMFVHPALPVSHAVLTRPASADNRVQGWTAAALAYFAALLGEEGKATLPDIEDGPGGHGA